MCGIVGAIPRSHCGFIKQIEDTFFQMLTCDAVRGDDSTGLVAIEDDSTFSIAKAIGGPEWFISQYKSHEKKIHTAMWNHGKAYIGHNRKKTSGTITEDSAHPFVVDGRFAMVHNGTLYNHEKLAKTEVDSEALAIHLAKAFTEGGDDPKKVVSSLEDALGDVYGAYAVAMYDQELHRVYLLRNKERPLSFIEVDNAFFFMSEPLMGAWLLARNGYKYSDLKFNHLQEHELITINLQTNKVLKDQLTPKKSQPPKQGGMFFHTPQAANGEKETGTGTGGGKNTTAGNKGKPIKTEKELKKFRGAWLGKRIHFWADDYLEKHWPRTVEQHNETEVEVFGQHEDMDVWHTIKASVDMAKLGLHYTEDITSKKWTGVIEAMSVTKTGCVIIELAEGAKPMAQSTILMSSVKEAKELKIKLRHMYVDELNTLYEETKNTTDIWKLTVIRGEISFRNSIKDIGEAAEAAANQKVQLNQKEHNGKLVYVDDDGCIFYESSIVVH